ncbi:hypothetical protein EHF33_19955 (plasmid) [Deinococcus psychrotolerans]|uniref:Uncharacterized protein n=1 Tax=Deinococcus psychrotolerans TaxID=2489213 RepID=A0A3G8YIU2_9DEIO|nr:hypothetical protein [Deinococcus psychrotolerans]AZI45189.1 hypothetical protein EHF33_19955 [Deinococcus psychrotolerans]
MDDLLPYSPETHVLWNSYATAAMAFLIEEGLEPWLDEEADVLFRHEDELYLLATHTADAKAFQLVHLPLFFIPGNLSRLLVHEAVAYAQQQVRVGRLIVLEAHVNIEVTHLLPNQDAWRSVFWKSLDALVALRRAFQSRLEVAAN